jgi:MFS family permease
MEYAADMGRLQSVGDRGRDFRGGVLVDAAAGAHEVAERSPRHELHDDEGTLLARTEVEDADDVRVLDGPEGLGLAMEALDELGNARKRGPHDLHRDLAVKRAVVRAEDVGHAAAADAVRELVAAADQAHDDGSCKRIADVPILSAVGVAAAQTQATGRPVGTLPIFQIFQLSIYWFGINAIWGGLNVILQRRMDGLVGKENAGSGLALLTLLGAIVAILVQPTIGTISDYTITRWGRRKPYIVIGAVLDVVFLAGVATATTYVSVVAFIVLLQISSNFAQGPFQGYVPDLVPAPQVGLASGLMGLMIILGRIGGVAIASIGLFTGSFVLATIGLGLLELATAIVTVITVDEGRVAPSREGRSWLQIATGAWGLDILKERSFVWLLGSRLFVLMATVTLTDFMLFYMSRSIGLSDSEIGIWINVATGLIALTTALTTFPAARLSDRLGRKTLVYFTCALGSVGMLGVALAPNILVSVLFVIPVGIAAGAFLAVDWALMTDIVPKATSGRYMGISNVVTGAAGPIAVAIGGIAMDRVGASDFSLGPRIAFLFALVYYALGALLLRPVDERRRE